MGMRNMKVCLVALVILVSNQATAENERTSGGRQAKQLSLSEPEQKYDLELSFPVDSDEATNVDDGRRERIDQLIQEILSNEALAVNDTLPGTLLDPSSIIFEKSFKCQSGQVVVDDQCVPCPPGTYFDEAEQVCTKCAIGFYNPEYAQRACTKCPTSKSQCTNRCLVSQGEEELCDVNAICLFKPPNDFNCQCKFGYNGTGIGPNSCFDPCDGFCRNSGLCLKNKKGEPYCQCAGSFTGLQCAEKSEFAYIAGGIAGAVLFVIVLVLLVWMICVRSARNRARSSEKFAPSVGDMTGSQVNFYYGAPAPYAESIAPSHHGSTYAHYYEDEEDGWGMPNYAYDTYGKNSKIARSNGSLYNAGMYAPQYGPQGEFYDRVGKHTYQPRPEEKSGADTSSESDDDRSRRQ